jgi:transcriptional regulator with XRE-family HTH domain
MEQLQAWEAGEDHPTLVQLRAIAALYKRPFSDFYLDAPPEEAPFPHDFRRLPGEVALNYSPVLRYQMRLAQSRRDIFLELANDMAGKVPPFGFRATMDEEPESRRASVFVCASS